MSRVLVTRRLPAGGLDPLVAAGHEILEREDDTPLTPDQLVAAVREVDALVCLLTDRIDAPVLDAGGDRLRVVANVAVGYDNVDVASAQARGITVCNTPGVLDETTADLAFFLVLAASRGTSEAEADLRADRWTGWGITQYLGHDVHGASLGLVGYGRIGRAVARRATGFGMNVVHHTRTDTGEAGWIGDLHRMLGEVDIVSVHVPLTGASRHLIGAAELAAMRPTAVLVNTSAARWSTRRRSPRPSTPERSSRRDSTCSSASRPCTRVCSTRRGRCCSPTSDRRRCARARAWRRWRRPRSSRSWPVRRRPTSSASS